MPRHLAYGAHRRDGPNASPNHVLRESCAGPEQGAELIACLGGPAYHRQRLAHPLPSRGQHVALDVRGVPAEQRPDCRQGAGPVGEHGPAVTSSTLCPVTLSQSSTDKPRAGSTPRRLAAKSTTVATSTL